MWREGRNFAGGGFGVGKEVLSERRRCQWKQNFEDGTVAWYLPRVRSAEAQRATKAMLKGRHS